MKITHRQLRQIIKEELLKEQTADEIKTVIIDPLHAALTPFQTAGILIDYKKLLGKTGTVTPGGKIDLIQNKSGVSLHWVLPNPIPANYNNNRLKQDFQTNLDSLALKAHGSFMRYTPDSLARTAEMRGFAEVDVTVNVPGKDTTPWSRYVMDPPKSLKKSKP